MLTLPIIRSFTESGCGHTVVSNFRKRSSRVHAINGTGMLEQLDIDLVGFLHLKTTWTTCKLDCF